MAVRLGLVMSLVIAAFGALGWGVASAQYPAPLGLCTVTPGSSTVTANSPVTFTISATTTDGKGAPSVPGTVNVTGGSSDRGSYSTDASGKATVTITPGGAGMLTVNVTAGTLSCSSVSSVIAQKTNPDVIKPPDTGTGHAQSSGFNMLGAALAAATVLAVAGGASAVAIRRRG